MAIAAPLALYETEVRPEWVDYNDHMNVACYVLAFDLATDAFFDFVGVGEDYAGRTDRAMFAVEAHLTYQRELGAGETLRIATQLLGFDAKRLHFFHQMFRAGDDRPAATSEWLALHVDRAARRSAPLPQDIAARLAAVREAHAGLPIPPEVGRLIALKPPRAS
jgi:acyl-CoA thioester hydrolase